MSDIKMCTDCAPGLYCRFRQMPKEVADMSCFKVADDHQAGCEVASAEFALLSGIVPKRDAVIVEFVGDRFVISIECHDSTNEGLLQQMAKDIMNIAI